MSTVAESVEREDQDIIEGLLGNKVQRDIAFAIAYARYVERLEKFIRYRYPLFDDHEARTVVNDSFLDLAAMVRDHKFSGKGRFGALVFAIAKNKAADSCRKSGRVAINEAHIQQYLAEMLRDTEIGSVWKSFAEEGKANDVMLAFRALLTTLPPVQQIVGKIMAEKLSEDPEKPLSNEEIAEIARVTNLDKEMNEYEVKSAKAELRKKFRELLNRNKKTLYEP